MSDAKNKSAVHLGRLSAKNRREKLGEAEFKKAMKLLRGKGRQKKKGVGKPKLEHTKRYPPNDL